MPSNLLLEAGFWGLPPGVAGRDPKDIPACIGELLEKERLGTARIRIWFSAARFGVLIEGLAEAQAEVTTEVRGPRASQAFDINRVPTPAATGFANSQGVSIKDLVVREVDGEAFVFARKLQPGGQLVHLLPRLVPLILASPAWRVPPWKADAALPQPPAYVCLLLDEKVPTFSVEGVPAGREIGLREGLTFRLVPLERPTDYPKIMTDWGILPLPVDRQKRLESDIQAAVSTLGTARKDKALLETIAFELEKSFPFLLDTPPELLSLPTDLALELLAQPPSYIPCENAKGEWSGTSLVGISPFRPPSSAEVAVRASDLRRRIGALRKTWLQDVEKPLADRVNDLKARPSPDGIGSLHDHALRVARRAGLLNRLLNWNVPAPLLEKGVMYFAAGRAMAVAERLPSLAPRLPPLVAEAQAVEPALVALLKEVAACWEPKSSLPTTPTATLILLAWLLNRSLPGSPTREISQERILHLLCSREIRLDLARCFTLEEDPQPFDAEPWRALVEKRLQKEGISREKGEWLLRQPGLDPVSLLQALRAWPQGPPPGMATLAALRNRIRYRLQQVKIESLRLTDEGVAFASLEQKVAAMEAMPTGAWPALYDKLMEGVAEIEVAINSLPPVIDETSSPLAGLLRLLQRVATQLDRLPYPEGGATASPPANGAPAAP
ncbi:MAG: Glycyl-tRNA synthetase beta chain [Candidatus Ozemobacter sibiricus]|uniref:glycine--tRNA ligase n=1 Tax=Candidatus Ozemobacter sibiricus TaxID=2268124 RepID=A0A367ZP58_9BACT|nr:MAG: Glycyl-tRNA synthetase beta chain [Candidatus Ozemobacter sibiricus]